LNPPERRFRPPARTERLARGLAALSVGLALAIPLLSLLLLFPLVENMPKWDQWSEIEVWDAHYTAKPVLPLLLKPYNGHLNVVPRFIFYAMGLATHWNVRVEVLASYALACLTLGLMLSWIPRGRRALLSAPVAAQVFSFLQFENFLSGYPMGQVLSQALTVATIACLHTNIVSVTRFTAAVLAAAAATFSWGAGLSAWAVGFAMLLVANTRRAFTVLWGCAMIASIFVVRYGSRASFPLAASDVPTFFLAVVGRAWTPEHRLFMASAMALGGFALGLFSVLAVLAWRDREFAARPWLWLGCATLCSAALISLGRAGAGIVQSRASHYTTATYPLVVACCVLSVLLAARSRDPIRDRRRPLLLGLSASLCLYALAQPIYISARLLPDLRAWAATNRQNTDRIVQGVATEAEIHSSHHPRAELVRWGTEVLRRHRLALFSDLRSGRLLGHVDRVLDAPANGDPIRLSSGERFTAEGWAVQEGGSQARGVHIWVGDRILASTAQMFSRPDVTRALGLPASAATGWRLEGAIPRLDPGQHLLRVTATDSSGLHHLLMQAALEVR